MPTYRQLRSNVIRDKCGREFLIVNGCSRNPWEQIREFFGTIKQKIESGIPEGDERRKILHALTTLQESHGKPTFAQRYTEFITAAADYVTLLTPFIPQLTQMLGHVLK